MLVQRAFDLLIVFFGVKEFEGCDFPTPNHALCLAERNVADAGGGCAGMESEITCSST